MTLDLSIIIVNWNSAKYIRKCLLSIIEKSPNENYEIIVVDNGSYDDCCKIIENEFPEVRFVQSKENMGFAKANNLGYRYSSGKNILFLNPDTEIIGSAIKAMYNCLNSLNDAGAVGCKLLNTDLSIQTSCIQPFPTIINQLLDTELLKKIFPNYKLWGIKPLYSTGGFPVSVDVISGACIMVKKEIFDNIGHFSTDYHMYTEDIDLCYKIKLEGYKNYYLGSEEIIHHGGGSTKKHNINSFSTIMLRESAYKYFKKFRGNSVAQLYKFSMLFNSVFRTMILFFLWPLFVLTRKSEYFFNCLNKWRYIFRWAIGKEDWVKRY